MIEICYTYNNKIYYCLFDDCHTQHYRKLTKEKMEYFCKVKYKNNSLNNDCIANIQAYSFDTIPSQKSKIQIVKENLGPFFILCGIIIFFNQFFLFQGCFNSSLATHWSYCYCIITIFVEG